MGKKTILSLRMDLSILIGQQMALLDMEEKIADERARIAKKARRLADRIDGMEFAEKEPG